MQQCAFCDADAVHRCADRCGFAVCNLCVKFGEHEHDTFSAKSRIWFDEFWRENRKGGKLEMKTTYPINTTEIEKWVTGLGAQKNPEEIIKFGRVFMNELRHVSFTEFSVNLSRMSFDIMTTVKELKAPKVYMILGGGLKKSNLWVCLLAWKNFRKVVTDIIGSPSDIPHADLKANVPIIHVDDMSYSGMQMGRPMNSISHYLGEESQYFIAVPYLGVSAIERLRQISPNLRFSKKVVIVPMSRLSSLQPIQRWSTASKPSSAISHG